MTQPEVQNSAEKPPIQAPPAEVEAPLNGTGSSTGEAEKPVEKVDPSAGEVNKSVADAKTHSDNEPQTTSDVVKPQREGNKANGDEDKSSREALAGEPVSAPNGKAVGDPSGEDAHATIVSEIDDANYGDLLVLDSKGQSRPFRDIYSGPGVAKKQLVVFIRHFFCGNCQEYLRSLASSITSDSLLSLKEPAFITIIGCGRPELIESYAGMTACPYPIYADPTRKLYDMLGMTRTWELGSKPEYIQTSMVSGMAQSIFQGLSSGTDALKGGDYKQTGGELLFEDGKLVWSHLMKTTRDHTEVTELRRLIGLEDKPTPIRKQRNSFMMLKKGRVSSPA